MKDNFYQHLICLKGDCIFKEKIIAMCYEVHKICRSEVDDIIAQKKEEGMNLSVLVKPYFCVKDVSFSLKAVSCTNRLIGLPTFLLED